MTDTYKVLGQTLGGSKSAATNTPQDSVVYTVPTGKQASVSAIIITNADSADAAYSLGVVKSGDATASSTILGEPVLKFTSKHTIIPAHILPIAATEEVKGGLTLASGDQLRLSSTSSSVIVHAYATEIA